MSNANTYPNKINWLTYIMERPLAPRDVDMIRSRIADGTITEEIPDFEDQKEVILARLNFLEAEHVKMYARMDAKEEERKQKQAEKEAARQEALKNAPPSNLIPDEKLTTKEHLMYRLESLYSSRNRLENSGSRNAESWAKKDMKIEKLKQRIRYITKRIEEFSAE